jgi:hypothetical protein
VPVVDVYVVLCNSKKKSLVPTTTKNDFRRQHVLFWIGFHIKIPRVNLNMSPFPFYPMLRAPPLLHSTATVAHTHQCSPHSPLQYLMLGPSPMIWTVIFSRIHRHLPLPWQDPPSAVVLAWPPLQLRCLGRASLFQWWCSVLSPQAMVHACGTHVSSSSLATHPRAVHPYEVRSSPLSLPVLDLIDLTIPTLYLSLR